MENTRPKHGNSKHVNLSPTRENIHINSLFSILVILLTRPTTTRQSQRITPVRKFQVLPKTKQINIKQRQKSCFMAPVVAKNRTYISCDACQQHLEDTPFIHFTSPSECSHMFHMDCLIDQVFARIRCPICRVAIEHAEMALDHQTLFEKKRLVDIFEAGIMRANQRRLALV
jgi:hypothetical protein